MFMISQNTRLTKQAIFRAAVGSKFLGELWSNEMVVCGSIAHISQCIPCMKIIMNSGVK